MTAPTDPCPRCLAQQRFAGTYASPNEDVLCGYHTSELRLERDALLALAVRGTGLTPYRILTEAKRAFAEAEP